MKNKKSIGSFLFENIVQIISNNFKIIDLELFDFFQKGSKYYKQFIFLQDQIIDNDVDWVSQHETNSSILGDYTSDYRNAIVSLGKVFSESHPFWDYLSAEEKIYYEFIIKEKYFNSKRPSVSLSDFESMTYSKHILALVPLKGLEMLFESTVSYEEIRSVFIPVFNGMQMMDDIDDFEKDLQSGQWNLIQYEVQNLIRNESLTANGLDHFELRVFYASGLCENFSNYVLSQYQVALSLSEKFNFTDLNKWLKEVILEVEASISLVQKINAQG